ncbi:MAG TPA: TerB family tellurite resistance protein [Alphaproteobacteria bacterium]|nr:TerB family tellurite resistance protein [Alphaproteobacteria bacterium]
MISRLKTLFRATGASQKDDHDDAELHLAAAALLAEEALMDGHVDESELETIAALLMDQFTITVEEAAELVAEGCRAAEKSGQLYAFTRVIKDRFSQAERVRMIEMLWQVALADGEVHYFESNMVRRVAGLLYVEDRESGEARKRVARRMEEIADA